MMSKLVAGTLTFGVLTGRLVAEPITPSVGSAWGHEANVSAPSASPEEMPDASLSARFASLVSSVKPIDHRTCESLGSALYVGDDL